MFMGGVGLSKKVVLLHCGPLLVRFCEGNPEHTMTGLWKKELKEVPWPCQKSWQRLNNHNAVLTKSSFTEV